LGGGGGGPRSGLAEKGEGKEGGKKSEGFYRVAREKKTSDTRKSEQKLKGKKSHKWVITKLLGGGREKKKV